MLFYQLIDAINKIQINVFLLKNRNDANNIKQSHSNYLDTKNTFIIVVYTVIKECASHLSQTHL